METADDIHDMIVLKHNLIRSGEPTDSGIVAEIDEKIRKINQENIQSLKRIVKRFDIVNEPIDSELKRLRREYAYQKERVKNIRMDIKSLRQQKTDASDKRTYSDVCKRLSIQLSEEKKEYAKKKFIRDRIKEIQDGRR